MANAYIVGAVRTATGRKKGRLSRMHPIDMGAAVIDELVDRTGIPTDKVDDVVFGVVMQIGAQAGNLGRNVAMSSKLALEVPGTTVDRQCGSSLQAIQFGAQAVMSGTQDVVISGGVEAMSTVEIGSNIRDGLEHGRGVPKGERLEMQYPGIQFSQFDGAELLAEKYGISREELDAFGLLSHQRAAAATKNGYFNDEVVPLTIDDIDLYEVNEAFGSVPLAWAKALNADPEKLNVNGGAQSLGHPLGGTGAKLMTTLVHELERRDARYGLVAICEGGGTANAMIIERMGQLDS